MNRQGRYPQELRERAVRMVFEHQDEHPSQWAAITSIAGKFGMTAETLRKWVRRAEIDDGLRPGLTTEGSGRCPLSVRRSPPSTTAEPHPAVNEGVGAPGHPEPSLPRRILVATFALALTAVGIAFAARAFRPDSSPEADSTPSPSVETSPIPPLTGEPRITAEIPLADPGEDDAIGGIAVGAGSAWVGLPQRGETDSVVRIDLATNEITAEIPVQEAPYRKRIAATDDAVWVASSGLLERIDPATNTVIAKVELPDRSISAIAAEDAAVWAVTIRDDGDHPAGILVRIDAPTNEIAAEIPLGPQVAGHEDEVVLGAGSVWVLGIRWFEEEDAEYGSDLIRVDPATNAIAARIPVGGFHMVVGTDEVWVRFPADGVFDGSGERWIWSRVDVGTNEVSPPFEFEDEGLRLVTPDALWSVGYDEQERVRVTRFDPETLEAEARSEPIRSYFHDAVIDSESRTVWVSAVWSVVRVNVVEEATPTPYTEPAALTQETAQQWTCRSRQALLPCLANVSHGST